VINQPMPYPPRSRTHVTVSHSWARSAFWVFFAALVILLGMWWVYFFEGSWLGMCA
jgi:hypothetical protein